ncbi:MAG: hypothetical protein LBS45_08200 [Synergistaceae bacterium]|jgi:hypothetical protein|nr:hypothetical protein [Synergistaceae bacterium]
MMTFGDVKPVFHHDDKAVYYAARKEDLDDLLEGGGGMWKDRFTISLSVAIPCALNMIPHVGDYHSFVFLANLVIAFSCTGWAYMCYTAWGKEKNKAQSVYLKLISQPEQHANK